MDEEEALGQAVQSKDDVHNLNLLLDQANEAHNANQDYERTLVEMSARVKERIAVNAAELQARQHATTRLKQELKQQLTGEVGQDGSDQLLLQEASTGLETKEGDGVGAVRGWVRGRPIAVEDILASEMDMALDSVLAEHDRKQQLKLLRTLSHDEARRRRARRAKDGNRGVGGDNGDGEDEGNDDNDDDDDGEKFWLVKATFTTVVVHNQVKTSEYFGQVHRFIVPNNRFTFEELQATAEKYWEMDRAFATVSESKRKNEAPGGGKKKEKKTAASIAATVKARGQANRISAHVLQNEGGAMYLGSAPIQPRLDADIKAGVIENPEQHGVAGVSFDGRGREEEHIKAADVLSRMRKREMNMLSVKHSLAVIHATDDETFTRPDRSLSFSLSARGSTSMRCVRFGLAGSRGSDSSASFDGDESNVCASISCREGLWRTQTWKVSKV